MLPPKMTASPFSIRRKPVPTSFLPLIPTFDTPSIQEKEPEGDREIDCKFCGLERYLISAIHPVDNDSFHFAYETTSITSSPSLKSYPTPNTTSSKQHANSPYHQFASPYLRSPRKAVPPRCPLRSPTKTKFFLYPTMTKRAVIMIGLTVSTHPQVKISDLG